MMGTPGTLRMRLLRSRSLAKTGVRACRVQRGTVGLTGNDVDAVLLDTVDDALHLVSWKWGKGIRDSGVNRHHRHMCPCDRMSGVSTARRGQLESGLARRCLFLAQGATLTHQGHTVLGPELFQLTASRVSDSRWTQGRDKGYARHDARGDDDVARGKEAVHGLGWVSHGSPPLLIASETPTDSSNGSLAPTVLERKLVS
jgi:hypothetical protein